MFLKKKINFKLVSCFLTLFFILAQVNIQSVLALQSYTRQNKICNIAGYRVLANNQIEIINDKGAGVQPSKDQFKLFEGIGTAGRTIKITSVTTSTGAFNSGHMEQAKALGYNAPQGSNYLLNTEENLNPGTTYTIVMSNTILGGTCFTLGHTNSNKDVSLSFTCPDTLNSGSNDNSVYNSSVIPTVSFMPGNDANNVSLEGNVWFNVSVPVANYDEVRNGLVLKRNGTTVSYAPFKELAGASDVSDFDCYAPLYNDDHTFFGFFLTQGQSTYYDYNWKPNSTYELSVPEIHTINNQVIPAQTLTFHTMNGDTPNKLTGAVTATPSGNNVQIGWSAVVAGPTCPENNGWPAADGYNVYVSTDPYWNFQKLNSSLITGTTYTANISGLTASTTYYVRVSPVANGFEGGLYNNGGSNVSFVTPTAVATTINVSGPESVSIPTSSITANYTATVKDQNGNTMNGENVTWSLQTPVTGVTIDTTTGVVTIDNTTTAASFTVVAADGSVTGSETTTLTFTTNPVPVKPAAPNVINDDTANTVTGMTEGMEYNLDNAGYVAYDAAAFSKIDFSGNHILLIRVAAKGIDPAGDVTTLTFTTNPVPVKPEAPNVTNDDTANTVTGMTEGMEYNLDNARYVAYDAAAFSKIDFSGNHTLLVRVAAKGIDPAGDVTTLTFTANSTANSGTSSSAGSSSGAGGGSSTVNTSTPVIVPVITKTDSSSNVVATLDASRIKNNVVNEIQIKEPKPESKIQVEIPTSAVANGSASFQIHTDSVKLGIPAGIIDSSSLSNGATLQVSKNIVPAADTNALLANVPQGNKSIGKVFAFNMAVCDSSNNVIRDIHNFASGKSVVVTINLSSDDIKGMNTSKISAFYFDIASKRWVDMGGSFNEKSMAYTFNTTHFTNFTIMEKSAVSANVTRLAGLDRIETSIAIAKEEFADKVPDAVVLTTANGFPDALSGEGLAYKYNGPMLLVNKSVNESKNVLDYITSTLSKGKNIYILGGTGVVSADISDYLTSKGYSIIRIGGKDRYETNQKVVENLNVAKGTSIVLASGNDFADALSVSSIAALKGYPVLLSDKNNLSANVIKDITNIQPTNMYIIGGKGALSADVEAQIKNINGNINIVRLGGNDRYETSMKIVDYFNLNTDTISVASGKDFPDALSGALLAARKNSSILLINNTDITKQKELLNKHGIKSVIIFGGEGVISSDAANSLIQK